MERVTLISFSLQILFSMLMLVPGWTKFPTTSWLWLPAMNWLSLVTGDDRTNPEFVNCQLANCLQNLEPILLKYIYITYYHRCCWFFITRDLPNYILYRGHIVFNNYICQISFVYLPSKFSSRLFSFLSRN